MKLQHLAVIFVLIIVPISLVLSFYINSHIETIEKQTRYTTTLINSTYDAAKAFQLNTYNNRFSTLSDSKIRDIEAAITTFYRTLGVNLGFSLYSKKELKQTQDVQQYTPAVLATLYDGYYIYTKYRDTENSDNYTFGLKPFIPYSCRYKVGDGSNYDFVVNYTLDNTITIIGKVNGDYVTKTGHLVGNSIDTSNPTKVIVDGVEIEEENLTETLIILDKDNNIIKDEHENELIEYEYVIYGNEKIYKDKTFDSDGKAIYFRYATDYTKNIVPSTSWNEINDYFNGEGKKSAMNYYKEAKEFTKWVNDNIGDSITQQNAVDMQGNRIMEDASTHRFATNLENAKIFNISSTNNPLDSSSIFNEQRMNVIRYSIETNLSAAINSYSEHSQTGYEFAMPVIQEDDWYNIENNICFVSFLQGIPIGNKIYSNYCVVANNTNQETVGADSIYIIDSNKEYHRAGCKKLNENLNSETISIKGAYASSDFKRKTVATTGSDANAYTQLAGADDGNVYFFPQGYTACYDCIVNMSDTHPIDEIITSTSINTNLKKWYYTALARCRYNLYTINGYFGY